ncbi:cation:proton antiporter [Anaerococcus degeneri]|uniref:Cation:proton antiporter n=1 Tax=Anaerococcus degeneri TaxID=361500 RepID=A0ABS7Z3L8_9FIRM|nr:cation:proton antiporter [Anaerococcus degeneri]MBP2014933.1 NhaP-type Na+/H+ or K+/H+ antiporter [Anaerococcus degeneri]MCA2097141.1 cation:proton antiporter [Anaerococcus degeneri]
MILSLGLILIFGMVFAKIFDKLKLPKIIGMLLTGIILGPQVLNLLDANILKISPDLRTIALIVILLKAGLSLDIGDLKKVGRSAVLLSFLPASFEILAYAIFVPKILGLNLVDGLLMGAVMAAVSPAIVVPRMVKLIDEGYGKDESIPQMILAGASCDDVFVLVLFSSFLSMAKGSEFSYKSLLKVPVSIILGIGFGIVIGYLLYLFFERRYKNGSYIRNSSKVIIILALAFLLVSLESLVKEIIPISGLLAVIAMASAYKIKAEDGVVERLSEKFAKLWIFAEILLFVLVGAEVDIKYMTGIGFAGVLLIFLGLLIRSIGVFISVAGSRLSKNEKIFTILAYTPKATVQAAIGSVALANGIGSGMAILSIAVLGIIITAPLGAILIDKSYKKLLKKAPN